MLCDEGSGTNTSQIITSEVVVVTSDEENDEELYEKEVGEQIMMQEKEYAETVVSSDTSVNSRRLNHFGSF